MYRREKFNRLADLFQAGELFHSALSGATAQQRENEAHQLGEKSIDSPLLKEQVIFLFLS